MKKTNLLLSLCFAMVAFGSCAQFSVSNNHRFLLKNGKTFFWLGDTGWELFHRLTKQESEQYLKKRSEQGFTVIQAVALAELDGLNTPNANGDRPLVDNDPAKPNEAYFAHMDWVISKAEEFGLTIALLPTWGDKLETMRWGKGPEIFTAAKPAADFATWIAQRYKTRNNIIWVLGGDRNPRPQDIPIWEAMGSAIKKATNGKAVVTFHAQPNALGSAEWFHQSAWLDFNAFQTGHCRDNAVYDRIQAVYNMIPTKPVMDAEPIYEDHPVCFNVRELGTSNSLDVRRSAYLDVFAGAFGHTYGCHDVWQMNNPRVEPVNGPHYFWYDALDLPGANQMKYLRNLIETFPMLDRIPDQSVLTDSNTVAAERVQATRGSDYILVYSTAGKPFDVDTRKIKGNSLKGFWYDPRKGTSQNLNDFEPDGVKKFNPPTSGYGNDWVLAIFDAAKNYSIDKPN